MSLRIPLLLVLAGCSTIDPSTSIHDACDKLTNSCKLSTTGLDCSSTAQVDCARCINGASCDEIRADKCAAVCPTGFRPR